ncbi:MAG TPA: circadian clock KaiB family protein [Chloroflexota bacterium]|jgi:circadian clock protein KaiB|nr:circadian clock KaiB family protein [Chloroflexota bacterium]
MNRYVLRLYVAGNTPRSERAVANLRRLCSDVLRNGCEVEVIDVLEQPHRAEEDRVLATPTVIRRVPGPERRVVGDLSDSERVLSGLDVRPLPGQDHSA